MYKIINNQDKTFIWYTEKPVYIKKIEVDNCYVVCPEKQASGVMCDNVPYNLKDKVLDEGLVAVRLEYCDGGVLLNKQSKDLETLSESVDTDLTATQEALCDIYERVTGDIDSELTSIELALCDIYEKMA